MTCVSSAFAQAPPPAQPPVETFTGDIKADSPKLAGKLRYGCHEVDAAPGETLTIRMERQGGDGLAFFYVIGAATCDVAAFRTGNFVISKTAKSATLSVTAAGGRYWLMPVGWANDPAPYTITVQHAANDPKAKRLAAAARPAGPVQVAAAPAQAPAPAAGQPAAVAAPAAPPIEPQTLKRTITANHRLLSNGQRIHCELLRFSPGEALSLQLQMTTPGLVGRLVIAGDTCEEKDLAGKSTTVIATSGSLAVSSAGGGEYWMAITATGTGDFALTASSPTPGAKVQALPPATRRVLIAPTGTASTTAVEGTAPKAGTVIKDCDTCPKVVVVPAGSFMMGSASTEEGRDGDEGPRHAVTFAHAFAIGVDEVTFDEWDACVADKQCDAVPDEGWGRGKRPVINVSKSQARRYIAWLSDKTDHAYFLPSESEWEYAARAGTDTPWNTGDALIGDDANILNTYKRSVPVGSFPPNAFGLHDVYGNVAEWVQDCGDVGYFGVPADGGAAIVPADKCASVLRGGHWNSAPLKARSAFRQRLTPGPAAGGNAAGFRVSRAMD